MPGEPIKADVVIVGGGIAGLWLLLRLRKQGFNAVLLESDALGSGQTRFAQGIIHGGAKYALTGKLNASVDAIAQMPSIWRACLQGKGELDLSKAKVLSHHQYLWSTRSLTSRMAGFFASKLMRSKTRPLEQQDRPTVFQHEQFKGRVYRLDEPVIDTASLVEALAEPARDFILGVDKTAGIQLSEKQPGEYTLELHAGDNSMSVETRRLVLAAGSGNADLLSQLNRESPKMQLRPLHMVMLRGELPDLYAHCLGASTNPRITITTHRDQNGQPVWYLGGQLAEEGVNRSDVEQIAVAQDEVKELLPWVDFSNAQWANLHIDRAEPEMRGGKRPDTVFANEHNGVITAWPTKLALAPVLASEVLSLFEKQDYAASDEHISINWPFPGYASLPWQEEQRWN